MRIAILAHSTNPRGGVVHALELADSLTRLGHEATAHAPDATGRGFFRAPLSPAVTVMASPVGLGVASMVETRIADYVRHFKNPNNRRFDIFHAQDAISGNALATLKERGLIPGFARTVHHIDRFDDPRLTDWQLRSILSADALFVVSEIWRERIRSDYDRRTTVVGNGVDTSRFTTTASVLDTELRTKYGLNGNPILLSVGGVEERKNTLLALQAFVQHRRSHPGAQWLVAGGASLLDHDAYQAAFRQALQASGAAQAVILAGTVPDAEMPALFRLADGLLMPSVREGFGVVVLEALARATPVVVSRRAPFTEYLAPAEAHWADPDDATSIAAAMSRALQQRITEVPAVCRRYSWPASAARHVALYRAMHALA